MENIVANLISRPDGLNHLLLSDVNTLLSDIQTDFPELAKVYSIGKSSGGRDINVLELSLERTSIRPKENNMVSIEDDKKVSTSADTGEKPAILMTGATHARELISTTQNIYEALKLIKQGYVDKEPEMEKLLAQNKYYFLPVLNVDGVDFIEENWKKLHRVVRKRKNGDNGFGGCEDESAKGEDVGVDLNRNFGIDFGVVPDIDGQRYAQDHNPT